MLATPPTRPEQKSWKILLIEDNPVDVALIDEMLSNQLSNHFVVINARSLGAGLDSLSRNKYDVILLDLALPDSVGMETVRAVIQKEPQMPVVVLTGLNDEVVGIQSLHEGAQDYLIKGQITGSTLIRSLRYAGERKRIELELIRNNEELDETNRALIKASEELRQSLDILTRREKALQESEQKFRDIFNNTTDAIHLHEIRDDGTPGRFTDVNDVACRLLGYTREEMLAKTPLDITTDFHKPPLVRIFEEQQTYGKARFETEHLKKNGEAIPVEINTRVVAIQGRKGMLGVIRDITERKINEKALEQVNKKLNLLSSITRHDILNQLLVLRGYLELSRDFLDNREMLSGFLKKEEDAVSAIERQIVFTREYQDLGVKAPVWQPVYVSVKKAQASLSMRNIEIVMNSTDYEIFTDPLFEKVFYNLIDNALRYGGPGMTTIHISSIDSERGIAVSVEDDGVGISEENKKRLFERGFGSHTGLGLFLSREILAITGITITENGEPGKGARFNIIVPKGGYRLKDAH